MITAPAIGQIFADCHCACEEAAAEQEQRRADNQQIPGKYFLDCIHQLAVTNLHIRLDAHADEQMNRTKHAREYQKLHRIRQRIKP